MWILQSAFRVLWSGLTGLTGSTSAIGVAIVAAIATLGWNLFAFIPGPEEVTIWGIKGFALCIKAVEAAMGQQVVTPWMPQVIGTIEAFFMALHWAVLTFTSPIVLVCMKVGFIYMNWMIGLRFALSIIGRIWAGAQ